MRCIALLVLLSMGMSVYGDEKEQALASLALAKAKREREHNTALVALAKAQAKREQAPACHTDLGKAIQAARKASVPVVLWVGMQCEALPAIRDGLTDCIHCHTDAYNGDSTPRLLTLFSNGVGGYSMPKTAIGEGKEYPLSRIRQLTAKQVEPVIDICVDGKCQKQTILR